MLFFFNIFCFFQKKSGASKRGLRVKDRCGVTRPAGVMKYLDSGA